MKDQTPEHSTNQGLAKIADYLRLKRPKILQQWHTISVNDEEMTTPNALSKKEFFDHIPQILDLIDHELRFSDIDDRWKNSRVKASKLKQHGLSRWQQGFNITEVVQDWNHFRSTLINFIKSTQPKWKLPEILDSLSIITQVIEEGIRASIKEFEELRQVEAKSHLIEMEQTIEQLEKIVDEQAQNYQEVAHDLEGNLGILSGLARAFKNKPRLDDINAIYEPIENGLQSSLHILRDLHYHSYLESGAATIKRTPININALIMKTIQPFIVLAEKRNIEFICKGPQALDVDCDSTKLSRILHNLLSNAFKFTKDGEISLAWGSDEEENLWSIRIENKGIIDPTRSSLPIAKALIHASESCPQIVKADSLPGQHGTHQTEATSEQAPEVAEVAKTVEGGDKGIGLTIAKRLADLMGGRLLIEVDQSTYGVCAKLVLPLEIKKADTVEK